MDFAPPPFSLEAQPQRPGELAELIDVNLTPAEIARVAAAAAQAGLPLTLWLYIAVEAERALAEVASVLELEPDELIAAFDAAVQSCSPRGPRHVFTRRLDDYAGALVDTKPATLPAPERLSVRVPHRIAAGWAHAAAAAGRPFDCWLTTMIAAATGREHWEAAAAADGQTLAEWVWLQAARCARSRSTSPHATASG